MNADSFNRAVANAGVAFAAVFFNGMYRTHDSPDFGVKKDVDCATSGTACQLVGPFAYQKAIL